MSKKVKKKAPKAKPAKKKAAKSKAAKPARKAAPKAPKAAPSTALRDRSLGLFNFAHGVTTKYAGPFTDANATAQPLPTSNHAIWNLGHIAISNAWFASLIDGKPVGVPDAHDKLFGMGSKPSSDAAAYPSLSDVKAMFDASAARLSEAVKGLTDADLTTPCAADSGGFCTDKLDAVLKAAWHEGWHIGQIAELRKALNLVPANG